MPTTYVVQSPNVGTVIHATTKMFSAIDVALTNGSPPDPQVRKELARQIREDKKEYSKFTIDVSDNAVIHVFDEE